MSDSSTIQTPKTAILTGPTATGKTGLAISLCLKRGGIEIINADSLLIYRGMDIGTAKPSEEEKAGIPHYLIDIRDPDQGYTAADFVRDAKNAMEEIHSRGHRALIVGGTGFYLKALLYGMWEGPSADPALRDRLAPLSNEELYSRLKSKDSASAIRIGVNDRYRLVRALEVIELSGKTPTELRREENKTADPSFALWIIDRDPEELKQRIALRTEQMMDQGLIEETQRVRSRYPTSRALQSVGYSQVISYLDGVPPAGRKIQPGIQGLKDEITLATRQLVKAQRTWFKGQHQARWFSLDSERAALEEQFHKIYG